MSTSLSYQAAAKIINEETRRVYTIRDPDAVVTATSLSAEDLEIYVMSSHCTKFKKIDSTLVSKYQDTFRGNMPRRVTTKDALFAICSSMYLLYATTDTKACNPCEANPYRLLCKCKGSRKIGICSHILAVTHLLMKKHPTERLAICNVLYLIKKLAADRQAHRPRKARGGLVIEDSSDEEDEAAVERERGAMDF